MVQRTVFRRRMLQWRYVAVLAIACVGGIFLAISHAGTPTTSVQAEAGQMNSPASSVTDTSASDGKAVRFSPAGKLVWSDEFNGASGAPPTGTDWGYETGGAGWGNNELECYTNAPGNAQTNGQGQLVITALKQPGHICSDGRTTDYTSARLDTYTKHSFTYGRFEARMKVPTDSGMWPAFWAVGTDEYAPPYWPYSGEIDVMEVIGTFPGRVYGTVHGPMLDANQAYKGAYNLGGTYTLPSGPLSDAYHTYGATWTNTQLSFDIDGMTYYTITKAQAAAHANPSYQWEFDKPFFLRLNLAVGGNFPGSPAASTVFPQRMLIDYVRVYQ